MRDTHMQIPWLCLILTFQLAAEDSLASLWWPCLPSGVAAVKQAGWVDGQNDRQAVGPPCWLILRDEKGGGEIRTVMEIIKGGSELYFSQNYNMATENIWSFSCFSYMQALHLWLHSYISLTSFLENNLLTFVFYIQLEPTFVCSCQNITSIHTAGETTTTTVSKDHDGGWLDDLSLENHPLSPHFYSQCFSLVSREVLYRSHMEVVTEWLWWKKEDQWKMARTD